MIRAHKMFFIGLALTTPGVAFADDEQQQPQQQQQQQQPPTANQPSGMPTRTMAEKMSASATVEKVDTKKRELTLKDDKGNTFMVQVPEDVTNFENLKRGDKINIDYYQSVTLALKKSEKGAAAPSGGEQVVTERAAGNLPGGLVARKITAVATVQKVDPTTNNVTIKAPDGTVDTINVSDPSLQTQLSKMKKGDKIQASYTEAMAITVSPKSKEQQPQ